MPPPERPHDDATETALSPQLLPRTAARRRPTLAWTDAAGAHTAAVDARVVLGSGAGVDVALDDRTVSRLHAELELRDDGLWVRDLGSRNGTFVDGVRVGSALVPDGGTLRLGATTLALRLAPAATEVELWPDVRFGPLIGLSAAMRELFARLARVAAADATVLVQGETGTGKELVARALHERSPRRDHPLVVVDCGALPETLLEAELFGHARGAFTGAVAAREGAFESAEGGTVFLDEVGELPLAMQPKLLRVLESRTVRRVGESQQRPVNVRFVSATHRDLRTMVNQGAFREDLYFRLAVLPVTIPPLRERPEDIPALVAHFLPPGADSGAITEATMRELVRMPWLGNVRELRNFVERAAVLGPREALALGANAPPAGSDGGRDEVFPPVDPEEPFKTIRDRWVDHLEREYLQALLKAKNRNISAVAEAAGLDRTYVYRLMRKHGL